MTDMVNVIKYIVVVNMLKRAVVDLKKRSGVEK